MSDALLPDEERSHHIIVVAVRAGAYVPLAQWRMADHPELLDGGRRDLSLARALVKRLAKHLDRDDHPACRVAELTREAACATALPDRGSGSDAAAHAGTSAQEAGS